MFRGKEGNIVKNMIFFIKFIAISRVAYNQINSRSILIKI